MCFDIRALDVSYLGKRTYGCQCLCFIESASHLGLAIFNAWLSLIYWLIVPCLRRSMTWGLYISLFGVSWASLAWGQARDKHERVISLYFDPILAPIWPLFSHIFTFGRVKKGSSRPPSAHISSYNTFPYFQGFYWRNGKMDDIQHKGVPRRRVYSREKESLNVAQKYQGSNTGTL